MKYGILGEKLSHTFSPRLHKILGNDNFFKFEIPPEQLDLFFKNREFKGINVTMPYKQTAIKYLDRIDQNALEIGAVNAIVNDNGLLCGYNTDYYGMEYTFDRHGFDVVNKNILILGSGGASLTAQTLCKNRKAAKIGVVSRNGKLNYSNIIPGEWDYIINATPAGMYPDNYSASLPLDGFSRLAGVFDLIYNPLKTRLVLEAGKRGIPAAGGLLMLCAQAKKADDLFFGRVSPNEVTDRLFETIQRQMRNYVLIGMPGCGKTTIGKSLAKKDNRRFIDTDTLICRNEGMTIPEIFDKKGEEYFRKAEEEIISEISKENGVVIATGGGAAMNPKNLEALKQNGLLIYIRRDINLLATEGRPLSLGGGLHELYKKRAPVYENAADLTVEGSIDEIIKEILA